MHNLKVVKKTESGRSMIEMLGVLAIIGVLTVSSIGLYSQAMDKLKRMQVMETINTLAQEIDSYYIGQTNYPATIQADLESVGIMETSQTHAWGGTITVAPNTDTTKFDISLAGLADTNCNYLKGLSWPNMDTITTNDGGNCTDDNTTIIITY